jgi:flagellar motor switch protein FliN/FliY
MVSKILKGQDAVPAVSGHLIKALTSALSSMTGKDFSIESDSKTEAPDLVEPMVWQQTFSISGEPALWLVAGKDLWSAAGQYTLAAVGIDSLTDDECRSTWQEIVGQTMGAFASELAGDLEQEVTASKGEEVAAAPEKLEWLVYSANCGEEARWLFKAAVSKALIAAYERPEPEAKSASTRDRSFSKTFDLLLDVALPVSVSFGRTSLQIREVLKLNTGSIVELNRFVTEPVDVIVNDCVIARGEVVVVDGNYGVRITQLSSREDRLRTGMMDSPVRVGEPLR